MRRTQLALLIAGVCGCSATGPSCGTSSPLVGNWRYSGERESPVSGALTGTLSITAAGCGSLTGQLDLTETDQFGASHRMAGMVSGALFDDGSIRFDAELPGGTRQHLAVVHGDSLEGSWASANNGSVMSGSFGGHRK